MAGPLMLVDAAGLYFRAFYAVPDSVTSPDGRPVNAIRGYLDMSASLITRRRPSRYVACLDLDWRPAFRVALVPTYKAHRVAKDGAEDVPDTLSPQVPVLLEVLAALGLATAGAPGFEADDVIATIAAHDPGPTEIVTGDRDLIALATPRVRVLYTGRGLAKMEDLGPVEVLAKYGVDPERYADFAVLRGDPSDGLAGRGGRRREDGDRARHPFRCRRGHRRRGRGQLGRISGGCGGQGAGRARLPRRPRSTWCAGARTCRCPRSTTRCRPSRPTRRDWSSWPTSTAWTARSTGCWPR